MEKERHIVTTTIDWQGIALSVSYEAVGTRAVLARSEASPGPAPSVATSRTKCAGIPATGRSTALQPLAAAGGNHQRFDDMAISLAFLRKIRKYGL